VSRLVLPSLSHGASQVLERVLCVAQETHFRFEKSESNASFNCAPSPKKHSKIKYYLNILPADTFINSKVSITFSTLAYL
jgi:hypothetical protein